MNLWKAEFIKYLHEVKCYYPDHIVGMIVTTLIFYMFLLLNQQDITQTYIGFVYWYLLSSVISEAAVSISSEKQMGILEQLIIKPFPFEQFILVRSSVWLLVNLLKVMIVSSILSVILQIQLPFNGQILFLFLLATIGVFGFTLILVALTLKYTKTASFDSILSYTLLFFTGAIIPKEQMPDWAQHFGQWLPISQGINLTNQLLNREVVRFADYFQLTLQSAIYVLLGYFLFHRIYRSSKISGINRRY